MAWHELESLLIADGFRTVVMHSTAKTEGHRTTAWFKGEVACGLPADRVAGIMLNAKLVIANDSGPAHLAGILGVPTLVLVGGYPGDQIFGCYPNAKCIQEAALQNITPETVATATRAHGRPSSCSTLSEFYRLMESRLGTPYANEMGRVNRDRTMPWVFRELERRFPDGPRIVETGCIRSPEDWSAGYATWLFGTFLDLIQSGSLTSIDNDIHHLRIAGQLCLDMKRVFFQLADSVAWLEDYDHGPPFSLIFLDSMDTWHPGHAEHGLAEAKAASRIVAPNGLIVFDDSPKSPDGNGGWKGKGRLGIPWLCENGWRVNPVSSYQCVLERV